MWKKKLEPDTPQETRRMRIACWIPRATNAHSEYVILIVFALQRWFHDRASMLHCTYFACRVTNQYSLVQEDLLRYVDVGRCYSLILIWDNFQNRILSPTAQVKSSRKKVWETEKERVRDFRIFPPLFNHGLVFCQQTESYAPSYLLWLYRGADKSLARPGKKEARKHVRDARDFNNIETRAVINFFFLLRGKAPKEIHAILTETLACFLPGQAKELSAPLYYSLPQYRQTHGEGIRHSTDDNLVHLEVSACVLTSLRNVSKLFTSAYNKLRWAAYTDCISEFMYCPFM